MGNDSTSYKLSQYSLAGFEFCCLIKKIKLWFCWIWHSTCNHLMSCH